MDTPNPSPLDALMAKLAPRTPSAEPHPAPETEPAPDLPSKWAKQVPAKPGYKPKVASLPESVRFAIRFEYLTAPDTTMAKLGTAYGLSEYQVSRVLDGPEYQAMRDSLNATQVQQAQDKLAAMRAMAVQEWGKAIPNAAKQGKHQAARDLLIATGVIQESKPPATVSVQIGVAGDGAKVAVVIGGPASTLPALPVPESPSPDE